jgi:predicted transcriptional regulator
MGEITKERKLFPNLLAELARLDISKTGLARMTKISITSIYAKFNGNVDWTLEDMDAIKKVLEHEGGQELTLDYLFRRTL